MFSECVGGVEERIASVGVWERLNCAATAA